MKFRNYSVPLKSCVGRVRSPGFLMNPSIRNRLEVGSEGRGDSMTNLSESGRFGDLRTVCAHAPDRGEVAANPDLIQRDEAVTVDRDHFSPEELAAFTAEYAENLARGKKQNPPIPPPAGTKRCPKQNKVRNLRDRLDIYRIETLRFLWDFRVPFTNNQAEQDVSRNSVRQKISCTFRTQHGAQMFCLSRSYISTWKIQGLFVLEYLPGLKNLPE